MNLNENFKLFQLRRIYLNYLNLMNKTETIKNLFKFSTRLFKCLFSYCVRL